jgi:hypothetical protein
MNTVGGFMAGSIVAKLLLDKTGWDTSIKAVDKDMTGLIGSAKKVSEAHQAVGKAFAGVGLAIVGSLAVMIKKTADFGDKLFDLQQITGISAATLSSFKLAADKSGSSLEGVALGLRFLGRNMSAATAGTGAAAEAFRALGISAVDSSGKLRPMDAVMMEVADRFASMENGAEKTALAIQLFGRSGSELIPFLNLGRAGLEQLRAEAERLGIVMSDQDAAAADKFKDALVSLQASIQGIGMTIGKILMPAAQGIAEMFTRMASGVTEAMNKNGPFTQGLVEMGGVFGVLVTAAGGFHLALALALKTMATTAAALHTTVGALTIATAAWTALASAVVYYILKLQELEAAKEDLNRADETFWEMQGRIITKLQDVATEAGIHHDVMAELYNSYGAGNVALAEQAIRMGEWEAKFPGITAALERVAAKSRAAGDALRPLADAIHGLTAAQSELLKSLNVTFSDDVRKDIKATEEALAAYIKTGSATPAGIKLIQDHLDALRASLVKVNPEISTLASRLAEVNDEMRRVRLFGVDAANTVSNAFGTLGDVVGGALGDIINSVDAVDADLFKGIIDAAAKVPDAIKAGWAAASEKARQQLAATQQVTNQIIADIISGFGAIMDGSKTMAEVVVGSITSVIAALGKLVIAEVIAAKTSVKGSMFQAVARHIANIFKSVPFPLDIILAAGAFGVVSKLFKGLLKFKEGGVFTEPTIAEIGHGTEYVLPEKKLIDIVRSAMTLPKFTAAPAMAFAGAGGGGATVSVTLNGPLITSTGYSRRDIDDAGEYIVTVIDRQLKRVGRRL